MVFLLLVATIIGGVYLPYSVLASTYTGLFILVLVVAICGTIFGWKASNFKSKKSLKSKTLVVTDKTLRIPNEEEMKIPEDTATYDNIVIKDLNEVDLCKNIAYGPLSFT